MCVLSPLVAVLGEDPTIVFFLCVVRFGALVVPSVVAVSNDTPPAVLMHMDVC